MTWDSTDPKYRTREHRAYCAQLKADLKREGALTCTAKVCVMPTRAITNPNGLARDGLQAGHNDAGTDYDGPQHNACNNHDAARRGAQAKNHPEPTRWVL